MKSSEFKRFFCEKCNKDIRMLVTSEKLSVTCDTCRCQAKLKKVSKNNVNLQPITP
jgi:hypothetical protein